MAKFIYPTIGLITGKVGKMVFYPSGDGRQLLREYTKPKDPRTPKQLAQRAKFGLVSSSLAPLKKFIKRGHIHDKNAYQQQVSHAIKHAVAGEYPDLYIDYSKIRIASGNLSLPRVIRLYPEPMDGTATITWHGSSVDSSLKSSGSDKLYVVCHDTDRPHEARLFQPGVRQAEKATIALEPGWSVGATHFWVYFSNRELNDHSASFHLKAG